MCVHEASYESHLFNGELLPSHFSNFTDGLNVILQSHFETL